MTDVGSVYGEALYGLAREEGVEAPIMEQLKVLRGCFDREPDFLRLLSARNLSKQERCSIVDQSFRGKVHSHVLSFLKLLTEKGHACRFGDCVEVYRQHYNADHGIAVVTAVTAVPLTDAQAKKLRAKLGTITGKTIELDNRVDPACMGGVRLDYDGLRLDDTVAHRLDTVAALLKNTVV